jgi:hypothetical protein
LAVDRHLIATVLGAVGSLDAIGAWNAQTFDNLVVARHLYVDGHRRTGDEILDRDDLLPAKFEGRLVSVTPGRLLAVREAYSSTLTAQRSAWSGRNRTGAWPAVACSSAAHDSLARQS